MVERPRPAGRLDPVKLNGKAAKLCPWLFTYRVSTLELVTWNWVLEGGAPEVKNWGRPGKTNKVRVALLVPARLVARTVTLVNWPASVGDPPRLRVRPFVEVPSPPGRLLARNPMGNCPELVF